MINIITLFEYLLIIILDINKSKLNYKRHIFLKPIKKGKQKKFKFWNKIKSL
jgi:hypothetical protein